MFKNLKEIKHGMESRMVEEKKVFGCDLKIKKLNFCLYDELTGPILSLIKNDPLEQKIKTALNCVDSGLNTCIGKNSLDPNDFHINAEFYTYKNPDKVWKISDIFVKVLLQNQNNFMVKKVENCLSFYKKYCTLEEFNIRLNIEVLSS